MSRFAPVAPISLLRLLKEHDPSLLGDYHLVLAHDIVENRQEWEGFFPATSTVIIDNSIIELGKPVSPEILQEAYHILAPTKRIIVLPDSFDDPHATFIGALEYLNKLKSLKGAGAVEFMYVIQASRPQALDLALRDASALVLRGVNWLSVPRRMPASMGTRLLALLGVRSLQLKFPQIKIHLLGFSNSIEDDILCAQELGVEGIDSAVPLRLGQKGSLIDFQYKGDQAGPRGDYWTASHTDLTDQTISNMYHVREAIGPQGFQKTLRDQYQPQLITTGQAGGTRK